MTEPQKKTFTTDDSLADFMQAKYDALAARRMLVQEELGTIDEQLTSLRASAHALRIPLEMGPLAPTQGTRTPEEKAAQYAGQYTAKGTPKKAPEQKPQKEAAKPSNKKSGLRPGSKSGAESEHQRRANTSRNIVKFLCTLKPGQTILVSSLCSVYGVTEHSARKMLKSTRWFIVDQNENRDFIYQGRTGALPPRGDIRKILMDNPQPK